MAVKVKVNSDGCISCGACVAICPKIFKFNDNMKSEAVAQPQTEEEIKCVKEAAAACPVVVIEVEEDNVGVIEVEEDN